MPGRVAGKGRGMASKQTDLHCRAGGEEYVLRREGEELAIGHREGEAIAWLDERVSLDRLDPRARAAIDAGDGDSEPLGIAIQGIVSAAAERGG